MNSIMDMADEQESIMLDPGVFDDIGMDIDIACASNNLMSSVSTEPLDVSQLQLQLLVNGEGRDQGFQGYMSSSPLTDVTLPDPDEWNTNLSLENLDQLSLNMQQTLSDTEQQNILYSMILPEENSTIASSVQSHTVTVTQSSTFVMDFLQDPQYVVLPDEIKLELDPPGYASSDSPSSSSGVSSGQSYSSSQGSVFSDQVDVSSPQPHKFLDPKDRNKEANAVGTDIIGLVHHEETVTSGNSAEESMPISQLGLLSGEQFKFNAIEEVVYGNSLVDSDNSGFVFSGDEFNRPDVCLEPPEGFEQLVFSPDHESDLNVSYDEVDGSSFNYNTTIESCATINGSDVDFTTTTAKTGKCLPRPREKKSAKSATKPKSRDNANRRRTTGTRGKVGANFFRYQIGPHLRTLSSALELTGMKQVADAVPYEIMKRFHPTDMFRTIDKTLAGLEKWSKDEGSRVTDVEPDWKFIVENESGDSKAEHKINSDYRRYYKTAIGSQGQDGKSSYLSVRKDVEVHGKLKAWPDILTAIGSAELNATIDLHKIAENCGNTELKNAEGPLIMRLKEPKCAGILYRSGKLTVIGPKCFDDFRTATRRLARIIQKNDVDVKLSCLQMHFYIGSIQLPFEINVEAMTKHKYLSKFVFSDPDSFPGVILKMNDSPILCIVFPTGSIIMTESSGQIEMKEVLDKIYPTLRLFGY